MNEALSSEFFHFPQKMVASKRLCSRDCLLQSMEVTYTDSLCEGRTNAVHCEPPRQWANEDDVFFYPSFSSSDSKAGSE